MRKKLTSNSPKPTIILLHGLRGDHHGLSKIASHLESAGYSVLTPDLPGYAGNENLDETNIHNYAKWLHNFIKSQKLKKPVVIGHSMGSIIVSHFMEEYPEDSNDKAVFMSPVMRKKFQQKQSEFNYKLLHGFLYILGDKKRDSFLRSRKLTIIISHYLTTDRKMQKSNDEQQLKYSGRFSSADSLVKDAKISMVERTIIPPSKEVLLCLGEKDQFTSVKYARKIARENNCKLSEIKGTGHLINYERPAEVASAIVDFLEEN